MDAVITESVCRYSRVTSRRGFTLIELLVVLVLVGVIMSLVTVNLMPDQRSRLQEEGQRLALLLENAALDARTSGRTLAWSPYKQGYAFWRKNNYDEWELIEDDSMLRWRELPEPITFGRILLEDIPLEGSDKLSFSTTALPLPYQIELHSPPYQMLIQGRSTGEVELQWKE